MYFLLTPGFLHLSEETLQLGIVFLISDLHDVRGIISVRHRPKPKFFTGSHFWKLDSRFQCRKKRSRIKIKVVTDELLTSVVVASKLAPL